MRARLLPVAPYLTTMGMEMCYLYLGLVLLWEHLDISPLAVALVLALYPLSLFFKLTAVKPQGISRQTLVLTMGVGIALVLLVTLLAIRETLATGAFNIMGVILQLGFCSLAWWLGNSLAADELSWQRLVIRFQAGIAVILLLAAIEGKTSLPVFLFFVLAIASLILTRWETSLSNSRGIVQFITPWQIVLGGLAVLLPVTLIFLAFSPDATRVIMQWLLAVGSIIFRMLDLAKPPQVSSEPRTFDLSCSFKPEEGGPGSPKPLPPPSDGSIQISPIFVWAFVFVIFLVVLFLIFVTIRRIRTRRQVYPRKVSGVETTAIHTSLLGELRDFFIRLVKRLWSYLLATLRLRLWRGTRHYPVSEDEPTLSVRALYRAVLAWTGRQGLSRVQSQTPIEYLKMLRHRFPQKDKEFTVITDIYIRARYSRQPAGSEEFEAARNAWQRIKLAS